MGQIEEYGFTSAHLAPAEGIFRGTGPFVLLNEKELDRSILKNEVSQIIAFDPVGRNSSPSVYPSSLMGVLSVIRQSILETNYENQRFLFESENQIPTVSPHFGALSLNRSLGKNKSIPIWIESGSLPDECPSYKHRQGI